MASYDNNVATNRKDFSQQSWVALSALYCMQVLKLRTKSSILWIQNKEFKQENN